MGKQTYTHTHGREHTFTSAVQVVVLSQEETMAAVGEMGGEAMER